MRWDDLQVVTRFLKFFSTWFCGLFFFFVFSFLAMTQNQCVDCFWHIYSVLVLSFGTMWIRNKCFLHINNGILVFVLLLDAGCNAEHCQFAVAQRCQNVCTAGCHHNCLNWYVQWFDVCQLQPGRMEYLFYFFRRKQKLSHSVLVWWWWMNMNTEQDIPINQADIDVTSVVGHHDIVASRWQSGHTRWHIFWAQMRSVDAVRVHRVWCIVQCRE